MGARRADADQRRFFTEFESVKAGRLRAMGIIDPAKNQAVIPFGGKQKLIGVSHTRFPSGGGYSFFRCPQCGRRAAKLWLIDGDLPRCVKCCDAMNIKHASKWGFSREERTRARDKVLDELIAKLETKEPLRFKPAPASWEGKAQLVYRSRRLTQCMRRRMITLRLHQLASQQANEGRLNVTRAYTPRSEALTAIPELAEVWRARTHERLQQALDNAQIAIFKALDSDNPQQRYAAARLMLNTKQGRERGFTAIRT